jgi:hypothetical protein
MVVQWVEACAPQVLNDMSPSICAAHASTHCTIHCTPCTMFGGQQRHPVCPGAFTALACWRVRSSDGVCLLPLPALCPADCTAHPTHAVQPVPAWWRPAVLASKWARQLCVQPMLSPCSFFLLTPSVRAAVVGWQSTY